MTIDITTVLSIYSGVLTLLIGVIGFFLARTFKELDNKTAIKEFEAAKKDIEKNAEDIRRVKDNYLTKDDYFREQAKVDKKLDSIMDILMTLSKEELHNEPRSNDKKSPCSGFCGEQRQGTPWNQHVTH